MSDELMPKGYVELLDALTVRVRAAQTRASSAVNRELVQLYWEIGREILTRQNSQGWGAKVIDQLSIDLRLAFPGQRGFSARNLKYMRAFAAAWGEPEFVQTESAQIPWSYHCVLLDKVRTRPSALGTRKPASRTAGAE